MRYAALCLILMLWGSSAWGMTGNEWNKKAPDARHNYLLGMLEGWYYAGNSDGDGQWRQSLAPLDKCVGEMPMAQMAAILDKYLKDNPEFWEYQISSLLFFRVSVVCREKQ